MSAPSKFVPDSHEADPEWSKKKRAEYDRIQAESREKRGYGYVSGKNEAMGDRALPKEPDTSDEALAASFARVTRDGDAQDWTLFHFPDPAHSSRLAVYAEGAGGFPDLKARLADQGSAGAVLFGALRVSAESAGLRRPKYVYLSFVGPSVHELQRAQANPLKRKIQVFFGAVNLAEDLSGNELDDWTPESLGWRLLQSESSHKSELFHLGGGVTVRCSDLHADASGDESEEYDSD